MSDHYPDKKLIKNALRLLSESYPDAKPELEFSTPFELLVATILSAQCTDKQVNKATRVLFKLYNTPADFAALSEEALAPYIKTCGFFNTKGKNIIEAAKRIQSDFGGNVPDTLETLTSLAGVGRKTANVVLANAFGKDAIAVDTHVFRVSNRIGLAQAKDVYKTELQLMENIPKKDWSKAHHWLIFHGRRVCSARSPRCETCTVASACAMNLKRS
jgi:endonuclease-3